MSWRPPLAVRMALSTLVVTLGIIALIGGGAAFWSYGVESQRVADELDGIKSVNLPVLSKAVWDLADDRQEIIIDAILANDYITMAKVVHDGGEHSAGDPQAWLATSLCA